MRSDFLDREQDQYSGGGLGSVVGSLYQWSALSMLAEFSNTGEYYVPWAGMIKKGGIKISALGKSWGIREAPKAAAIGSTSAFKVAYEQAYRPMLFGKKFLGKNALGATQLFASRAVGFGLASMTWTDPAFFAFRYLTNPAMWGVGVAYFGGAALWQNTARAMERTRYVDMNVMFPETQASFTSRQRAVRAIAESHLQARSAIGNEAQLFHR
jgi:hypothetical protein